MEVQPLGVWSSHVKKKTENSIAILTNPDAKQTMFASKKVMIAANMLYVPFAALMLVMYDKAATKFVKKVSEARV